RTASTATTPLRPESVTNAWRPSGWAATYRGSVKPRSTWRTRRPSTIETAPVAVWQTTARSPTSSTARGSGCVSIEWTTRNDARSTTASRASASQVTKAWRGEATSTVRDAKGAAAARARKSRRFMSRVTRWQPRQVHRYGVKSHESSRVDERTGLRRPGLRGARADARRGRGGRGPRRRRGRPGSDGRLGGEAAADVRGRRAGSVLRLPRLRAAHAAALHRPSLGARRRAAPAGRELAGAGGASLLHGDAAGPARRHAAPPLPHPGAAADRHLGRVAGWVDRRRRLGRRLPP